MYRLNTRQRFSFLVFFVSICFLGTRASQADDLAITLQRQFMTVESTNRFHRLKHIESWNPKRVAVIICDVWDSHHCVQAVRRVLEVAPRINLVANQLRSQGATIIHAPSDCMNAYRDHPSRLRAIKVPSASNLPNDISTWCDQIPSEQQAAYPVDQSDGGEDDDPVEHQAWATQLTAMGRNPKLPWISQSPLIAIDADVDFITDSGPQVWNILEHQGIEHVLICGVHTNMCVLGRPFGLRQLVQHGKHAVLLRDLTDTMYNPQRWPYVDHFSGNDRVIDHVERYVAATTTSDQFIGGKPFRFSADKRPHLAILIGEDEYKTELTLPEFAATHLSKDMQISTVFADEGSPYSMPGIEVIDSADALMISIRRRPLPPDQLKHIRDFIASGKPVIGIRTASHAFSWREEALTQGVEEWRDWDHQVFGGNYTGHHGNDLFPTISIDKAQFPFARGTAGSQASVQPFVSKGSLYRTSPLSPSATVIATGEVEGAKSEPIAWTYVRGDSGKSFYTSLGHRSDFDNATFQTLLVNGIHWSMNLPLVEETTIVDQWTKFKTGSGRQRK